MADERREVPLPDGWKWLPLEEIVKKDGIFVDGDWVESKDQDPNGDVRLIQLADIGDGFYRDRSERFLTLEKANELGCTFLEKGDLLVARMPDPLGRACIFPGDSKKSVTVVDVCIIRTAKVNHRWLMHTINSPEFRVSVEDLQSGSTRKRISRTNLAKIELLVPPLPEQERIVAKIEELFTQLEVGMAALRRVQVGLKRYKAAVLKAACEGRLAAQDAGDEPAEEMLRRLGKEPLKGEGFGELPEGWCWARAEDICHFITKGTTPKASKLFSGSGDIPFIKVYNLTFDGALDFSINPTFVSTETHAGELARSKAIPGDVLMNIVGPPLGKVSIVSDEYPEWNMNQAIARFRPLEFCDRKFFSIALRTESVLNWAVKRAKATAGQFNLTLEICRDLPIPLPPPIEQQRIVAEVEQRLSVAQEVEAVVAACVQRAGRLRQAVLKAAFEGRLV